MLRSATSKVMWVGKATVFLVGLAMILALVFGVATTAIGATGDAFILGKGNAAERPTALVSTLADAAKSALIVQNKSGGAALNLRVGNATTPANSVAPMRVNSNKVVTKLNADAVDGKGAADFYAAGSKVADSDKVDGKDSSEFAAATHAHAGEDITSGTVEADRIEDGPGSNLNADQLDGVDSAAFWRGGTYTLYKSVSGTANSRTKATHTCNSGGKLLSGGYHMFGSGFEVYADFPYDNTYYLDWQSGATAANATLYVHCADF